ncbi:MAG: hypothetical protein FJ302_18245 [Planctomycetes bacterium]|nr:hypothetical protein [Planctomycetota bacterium]
MYGDLSHLDSDARACATLIEAIAPFLSSIKQWALARQVPTVEVVETPKADLAFRFLDSQFLITHEFVGGCRERTLKCEMARYGRYDTALGSPLSNLTWDVYSISNRVDFRYLNQPLNASSAFNDLFPVFLSDLLWPATATKDWGERTGKVREFYRR